MLQFCIYRYDHHGQLVMMIVIIMGSLFSAASAEVDHCLPQLLLAYAPVVVVVKNPDNQSIIQQIN